MKKYRFLTLLQENKTISNFSVQKSDDYHLFRTKKYPVMNRTFFVRGDKGHIANTYKKALIRYKIKNRIRHLIEFKALSQVATTQKRRSCPHTV